MKLVTNKELQEHVAAIDGDIDELTTAVEGLRKDLDRMVVEQVQEAPTADTSKDDLEKRIRRIERVLSVIVEALPNAIHDGDVLKFTQEEAARRWQALASP